MKISTFFFKLSPVVVLMAGMGSAVADETAMGWENMAGNNIEGDIGMTMGENMAGMTDMTTVDNSSKMSENVSDEDLDENDINVVSDSESGSREKMMRESRDIGMAGGPNVDITKGSETNVSNRDSTRGIGRVHT